MESKMPFEMARAPEAMATMAPWQQHCNRCITMVSNIIYAHIQTKTISVDYVE